MLLNKLEQKDQAENTPSVLTDGEKDMKSGLYANINKRRKAGKSRSKGKSTIKPEVYAEMKAKRGGFKPKIKSK